MMTVIRRRIHLHQHRVPCGYCRMVICCWLVLFSMALPIVTSSASLSHHQQQQHVRRSQQQQLQQRRLRSLVYLLPGFRFTLKVVSDGLELVTFTDELEMTIEQHMAAALLDQLPETGPLSVENFDDILFERLVSATPYDAEYALVQYNFTAGLVFSDASIPTNSTFVRNLLFEYMKATFLTMEQYDNLVARIENNPELQGVQGLKININPYFDPVSPWEGVVDDVNQTTSPASASDNNNDTSDNSGTNVSTIIAIAAAVIAAMAVVVGMWYVRKKRQTEKRIKQVEKLARQRSMRQQHALKRQQQQQNGSWRGGNNSAGSTDYWASANGQSSGRSLNSSEGNNSSSSDSQADGGGGTSNSNRPLSSIPVSRRQSAPATPSAIARYGNSSIVKPALASRRAHSLMAITEDDDELSEESSEMSSSEDEVLRMSLTNNQRQSASDSALGVRDVSQSSLDAEDLYSFANASIPNLQHPVMADIEDDDEDESALEEGSMASLREGDHDEDDEKEAVYDVADDDDGEDENYSNVSNADEEFEDEFRSTDKTTTRIPL